MIEKPTDQINRDKLLIDDPLDFQFHAAYIAYSKAFDETTSFEIKDELNQQIMALKQHQIDCQTFYRNISQFRNNRRFGGRYNRSRIKTQKKREWRRKSRKRERNKRHKN